MKRELALQLVRNILPNPPWDEERLQELFAELGILADNKYNQYEMYQPGRLFFENLYLWLTRFDEAERTAALEFVRRQLIFVSREEFQQLTQILYHDRIHQEQLAIAAALTGIDRHRILRLFGAPTLKRIQRASLYVAMTDGARIDYFRRQNLEINNEQVLATYLPDEGKVRGLLSDLEKDLGKGSRFECLFLIDDFWGSGRTLVREVVCVDLDEPLNGFQVPANLRGEFRYREDKQQLEMTYRPRGLPVPDEELTALHSEPSYRKGIKVLLEKYTAGCTDLVGSLIKITEGSLFHALTTDVRVFLCPLLITQYALSRLQALIPRLHPPLGGITLLPAAVVPDEVRITASQRGANGSLKIADLCENHYSDDLADEHTGNVKYGYDHCGLPLVLHHNTPNNSIYPLWSRRWHSPLFVRYERHGREVA